MGGVHPSENKLSCAKPIEVLPLPEVVTIPLAQHIGAPAVAKVAKGDKVLTGQLIAEAGSFMSANIHSPVSGTVTAVDMVPNGQGLRQMMITIKREGDEWAEGIDRSETLVKVCPLSAQEIVAKIKDAGIVGMGGATFPTHVKLSVPPGKKAECVIINGVECEPYLTSDHRTMLEHGEELVVGVTILMKAVGVEKAYIGIENNKPDAIAHLKRIAEGYKGIEVVPLKVMYPQGGEKQLIAAVTGRQVPPPPALPIDVGAVVCNASTTVAVYPCRAEVDAADRARGDRHGQTSERAQEPADPHGYAGFGIVGGRRGCSRRACEGDQRRSDDGSCDGQPRLARHEGVFGNHGPLGPRGRASRSRAVHQVRQVRVGLPDGSGTLLPLENDAEEGMGRAGTADDHLVHRVRMLPVHVPLVPAAAGLDTSRQADRDGNDPRTRCRSAEKIRVDFRSEDSGPAAACGRKSLPREGLGWGRICKRGCKPRDDASGMAGTVR